MAEDNDDSQKTEQPTGRRLSRAREQGQVPVSRELNNWFVIGGGTLLIFIFAPHIANSLTDLLENFIAKPDQVSADPATVRDLLRETFIHAALIVGLPILLLMVAGLAGPLSQTGLMISWEPLKPALSKLSLLAGVKRLFSVRSLVELGKSILKLIIVGYVCYSLIAPAFPSIEHLITLHPVDMLAELRHLILRLAFGVLATLTLIMIADIIYQRISFTNRMRMTRQEVKDETKDSEGDPLIKARIRQIRVQRARARMMANVPKADVVITNPTHFAIALKYDPKNMGAPLVLAKGQDLIALKIREIAEENKITIVENPPLARALYATVEIDEQIPPEHYKAVAEVISYVFKLRGRTLH
jgi:flagellar biosynthetic protein FlhB